MTAPGKPAFVIWLKCVAGLAGLILLLFGLLLGLVEWRFQRTLKEMRAMGKPLTYQDLSGEIPQADLDRAERFSQVVSLLAEENDEGVSFADRLQEIEYPLRDSWTEEAFRLHRKELAEDSLWREVVLEIDRLCAEGRVYFQFFDPDSGMDRSAFTEIMNSWNMAILLVPVLVEEGQMDAAEDLILRMLHWENAFDYQPSLIHTLVRIAGESLALESIRYLLAAGGFRGEEDRRRLMEWTHDRRIARMESTMLGERVYSTDFFLSGRFEKQFTNIVGVELGGSLFKGLIRPYLKACLPLLWEKLPAVGQWMDQKPYQRQRTAHSFTADVPWWDHVSRSFLFVESTSTRIDNHLTRLDLLEVALLLEGYRQREGAYPASLDDLEPSLPEDRFSGEALKYRRKDGDFLLYSVGKNLKDEHGKTETRPSNQLDVIWESRVVLPWDSPEE